MPTLIFVGSFATMLALAPWFQLGMSQWGVLFAPYNYMLNTDLYSLACRSSGVISCVLLALALYAIHRKINQVVSSRFHATSIQKMLDGILLFLGAALLPVLQVFIRPYVGYLFGPFSATGECARQADYYWHIWLYMFVVYFLSVTFSWMAPVARR